jgi:multiple sugar transport system substrate-binding protein
MTVQLTRIETRARLRQDFNRLTRYRLHTLALCLIQLICGCTESSSPTIEIDFWAMGREGEVVQQLIPKFERRFPEIRVNVQQVPWSAAHEKLLTAYAGGTLPDLFQLGNTWIPEFVALGALTELDPWIASSQQIAPQDFFPGIMQTNRIELQTYGIPWYVDTRLLFYRKDLLKRAGYAIPPTTWTAWIDALKGLKDRAGVGNYAILLPINEWAPLIIFALQCDAKLLKDNDQYGNFTSAEFRQAFKFYLQFFQQQLAPPVGNAQMANLYQEFAIGHISMYISGPWNIGEFRRRLPKELQNHWMTAPMPSPNAVYPGISLAGGASLVMNQHSEHPQAAWKLIVYLSQAAQQLEFYHLTGDLPARKAVWTDSSLTANPYAQAFWKQLQHVESPPQIPEWERITAKIADYTEAVIRKQLSVDRALERLDADVNRILEKRRWLLRRLH